MSKKSKAEVVKKPAKVVDYSIVVSDGDTVLLTLKTHTRPYAGSLAKLARENGLTCVITVPATVKERTVKIAGLD